MISAPLGPLVPPHAPLAEQEVALVEDQDTVTAVPVVSVIGLAAMATVGAGFLPPSPHAASNEETARARAIWRSAMCIFILRSTGTGARECRFYGGLRRARH